MAIALCFGQLPDFVPVWFKNRFCPPVRLAFLMNEKQACFGYLYAMAFRFVTTALLLFAIFGQTAQAQFFSFSSMHKVPLIANEAAAANPWTGAYNSGQFWPCDLNNDAQDDLLIFDKTSGRVLTFLAVNEGGDWAWRYQPDYEDLIPAVTSWIATADFNCDGRYDLFTQTAAGIKIYRNEVISPNQIGFVLEVDGLTSIGFSGIINVQVNPYGAPAITDVDGDGDLDVLAFDFTGNTVEFHRNRRMQNAGSCSGFDLKKDTCVFGLFATKPACGQIRLNTGCYGQRPGSGQPPDSPKRMAHIGSQLAAIDLDADGDKDLLVGDLGCPLLNRLVNGGNPQNAIITSADTLFPSVAQYVKLPLFPSAYFMDLNFDGRKDMVVTPTTFSNVGDGDAINTRSATYLYTDASTGSIPDFQMAEKDFMQNQTLDVGEESVPAFADIDADGDQDLLVGHRGMKNGNLLQASLFLYRNTGMPLYPAFTLETTDYKGLSTLSQRRIRPLFTDINEDGATDLCWVASPGAGSDSARLYYLLNQNGAGQPFAFGAAAQAGQLPFGFGGYDCPAFFDVNGDQKKEMLIGKNGGRIHLYNRTGTWPNFQYQLVNNNYGNVSRAPSSANVNLAIADVDKDGQPDLATGDLTGALKLYHNFLQSANATFPADSITYFNVLQNQKNYRLWGPFVSPALADLNGDNYPELALGLTGGGVFLMVNRLGANAVKEELRPPMWTLAPNPVAAGSELSWQGPAVEKVLLYSFEGKAIHSWHAPGNSLQLPALAPGFYVIQFAGRSGVFSQRLIIR